jgi:hypothetical protein
MEHVLVEDGVDAGRRRSSLAVQDLLALKTSLQHVLHDVLGCLRVDRQYGVRILPGLKESRDQGILECPDEARLLLVGREGAEAGGERDAAEAAFQALEGAGGTEGLVGGDGLGGGRSPVTGFEVFDR